MHWWVGLVLISSFHVSKITTKPLNANCLCPGWGYFCLFILIFFSSYQVWPSGCAWVLLWFLDGTNDTIRQPNSGFQDDFLIPIMLFLLLGRTCCKNMTGFFSNWSFFFFFFFPLSSLGFKANPCTFSK